jgi:hypothetical protein
MLHSRIRTMWRPLLLAPILLLLMASRIAPLVDPPPVPLPAGISQDAVVHAIGQALSVHGWRMVKSVPGEIDAVYDPREFSVTIAVHYDAREIQVNYVTSEKLLYKVKHGRPYIHASYARWIRNLITDLHNELVLETRGGDGAG